MYGQRSLLLVCTVQCTAVYTFCVGVGWPRRTAQLDKYTKRKDYPQNFVYATGFHYFQIYHWLDM